ncbi:PUA-like domain-containing protein [Xylaria intraflava]|nr:PUA-like domain-containing protein [Xylaria intraflava]
MPSATTATHPPVKAEPVVDSHGDGSDGDIDMEDAPAGTDPDFKAEIELGPDHDNYEAGSRVQSPVAPAADPVVKTEPEPDAYEADGNTHSTVSAPLSPLIVKLDAPQTVRVLNMGRTKDKKLVRMQDQGRSVLTLCRISSRGGDAKHTQEMANRFADAELYLDWLETSLDMTPQIRFVTKVDLVLQNLTDPKNNIPAKLVSKAQTLYDRYTAENWGEDVVVDDDTDTPTAPEPVMASAGTAIIGEIELPSPNDPIFGEGGIMYGIIIDNSGKSRVYRLRPDIHRRSAKAYGHNGIALGTWFPLQINALFWGAHGARMGGIAGSVITGAWSIVVASAYEDLDSDLGDTLYYSGSNSHTNDNPHKSAPPSAGTKALHASIATGNPVRVLRSGGAGNNNRQRGRIPTGPRNPNQNRYLPSCGLRYDGLYRVTLFRQRVNKKHGLYDQFKLERLPGQTPLLELQRTSPTADEVAALNRLRGKS